MKPVFRLVGQGAHLLDLMVYTIKICKLNVIDIFIHFDFEIWSDFGVGPGGIKNR